MNRGFANVAIVITLVIIVVGTGWWYLNKSSVPQAETQVQPSLTLTAPIISSIGDQILNPGAYAVEWKATGINSLTVSVVSVADGGSVVESGPITASTGSYTIQIPEVPGSKGIQPKYRFSISATGGLTAKSNPFVIGCLACDPPGY